MKKVLVLLLCTLMCSMAVSSFTQEIKTIKHKLSSNLTEAYDVLKNNKKIKNGHYFVIDVNKKIVVKGQYNNNHKDSIWTYYSSDGSIVQRYDFSENKLLENNENPATIVHESYEILNVDSSSVLKEVAPPMKIGGIDYGFYLLYDVKLIPLRLKTETRLSSPIMSFIFTISPAGKLEKWNVKITEQDQNILSDDYSIKNLPADAYEFIPAKANGKPVASKLIYNVVLHINQDFNPSSGSNNIMPTPKN